MQPIKINKTGKGIYTHPETGEEFLYPPGKGGRQPTSVLYYGSGDARLKDGTPLPSNQGNHADPAQTDMLPVELTEDERAIKKALKDMIAGKDGNEIGTFLSTVSKMAIGLRKEWDSYQAAERAKLSVPVDGFLAEPEAEPKGDSSK